MSNCSSVHGHVRRSCRQNDGSAIIIVMVFVIVFLSMGMALFYLTQSATRGTDTERKEVKAFNVAEAGVDAGMLALKTGWPEQSSETAAVSGSAIRGEFSTTDFMNPTRSDASTFSTVSVYDDDQDAEGVPYTYDHNGNNLMWVDSRANVDDDRHRILVLAKRHTWNLSFPFIAMYAATVGANGRGLRVAVDPRDTTQLPMIDRNGDRFAPAYYQEMVGRDVRLLPGIAGNPEGPGEFEDWVKPGLLPTLKGIAQSKGTYFTSAGPAEAYVETSSPGAIIYVESPTAVTLGGRNQIGTIERPCVLILDTPEDATNVLDFRGTADFYGVVVSRGSVIVRGTTSFWGSFITQGSLASDGNGSSPEVNYNGDIINAVNGQYTISVNIVPNTWEEYTGGAAGSVAGG